MYRPVVAPMGWNSWDCYGASVNEDTVKKNADFMAKHLKKYGWEYIVVDIQWYEPGASSHEYRPFAKLSMDEYGRLIPAVNRFPSSGGGKGFKPLADHVHSLGLKFGIHIMRGIPRQAAMEGTPVLGTDVKASDIARFNSICQWNPDMYGVDVSKKEGRAYYDSIFALYASWGVDFIKCDDICRELPHELDELKAISASLQNCGRDMVFSVSPGPALLEYSETYKEVCNMWRITDDFWDKWELLYAMFERAEKWSIHTGAGVYPDADMLPVGPLRQDYDKNDRTKFTEDEQMTMMSLWSIMRSPLMIGGEMTGFDDFTMSLLTNEELLRMHRDSRHAHQVFRRLINRTEVCVWVAQDVSGGSFVSIFNLGDKDTDIVIPVLELELNKDTKAYDIWKKDEVMLKDSLGGMIKAHGVRSYSIKA